MRSHGKRKAVLLSLLALVLAAGAAEGVYVPRYLTDRPTFDITSAADPDAITVMSANVRCFSPLDLFRKSWFYRAKLIVENVRASAPDLIGFQEVTPMHYAYLTETLQGYASVIEYRDRSPLREGCPVFYNTAKFTLAEQGSFWLSETPEVMSKSWGAAFNRVCSYVLLTEKASGKPLAVFNTHLDHISDAARIGGINVILDKLKSFGDVPCILMGDLNAVEDSETYRAATARFLDAKYAAPDTDSGATFQKWGKRLDDENIDYFMISKTGIVPLSYKVVRTTYDGVYPADHFPIELRCRLA